jgi:RNA polymerase sigma factor (sigma-70 family)
MDNPDGWTFLVGLNHARRRARRRARDRVESARVTPAIDGDRANETAADAAIDVALAALPPRMREVVVLRFVADLTEPAIAEVLRISRGTVSSTLRDARARLAPLIDPADEHGSDEHEDLTP